MPIRVRLIEERDLEINVDPEEWRGAVEEARKTDQMIEIRNSEGRVLAINPQHISYWVEIPDTDSQLRIDQEIPA